MKYIASFAKGFINLFQLGGKQFVSWVGSIVPLVLMMLVLMNAIIAILGEERMNKFAAAASSNVFMRYLILPFVASFMLGSPMDLTMARFLPEYYKPSYYASEAYFSHTSSGIFPHINPSELFIWLGIAQGVQKLGLDTMELAIRYFLVGLLMNFISGWTTDFTTAYVCKTSGIHLSKKVNVAEEPAND